MKKFIKEIKIIWSYLKKYRRQVFLASVMAVLASLIATIIPYIYGRLVDIVISGAATMRYIVLVLLGWLFLSVLGDWLDRFSVFKGGCIAIYAFQDMLLKLAGHLLDLPISYHKDKKMGEIIQRVSRGASRLSMIIEDVVIDVGKDFLTLIGLLVIMSFIEWRLTVLLVFVLILYFLVFLWKVKPTIELHKKMNKSYEKAFGDLYDSVLNVQTVKAFTSEASEKKRLSRDFRKKAGVFDLMFIRALRNLRMWQQIFYSFGFVFVFGGAITFLKQGFITAGQLVTFVAYINLAYKPFNHLAFHYRRTSNALTAISRAEKLTSIGTEPYQKDKTELKNVEGKVEFKSVTFSYKRRSVLKKINIKAKPGQMVALVGKSGVGKTTLVSLISRYHIPQSGKILIDGQDISEISLESLRKNIGLVPQEITLFNDTIKNNIRYARAAASDKEIVEAAKAAHAHEFIQRFDKKYNQLVGERGIKLSTGQKQRVAIARAILRNPRILILDEATASLDSKTERLVQRALAGLIRGRTTFVIAHRLSTIRRADQILVLKKGMIIERGNHQKLIKKEGVYKELCKLQATMLK